MDWLADVILFTLIGACGFALLVLAAYALTRGASVAFYRSKLEHLRNLQQMRGDNNG